MWQVLFMEPAKAILKKAGDFVAALLGIILIFTIGWLIAKVIRNLVTRFLKFIQLDQAAERTGISVFLHKGGIKYTLSELLGVLCYWLALLVVLVIAVNAVGLTVAADLLNKVTLYIPNVISAILVLVLGMFVATFLAAVVQTATTNAGIAQAKLLGKLVEFIIIIFTIAIALEQLSIGTLVVAFAINIILASLGLGIAIAFGLGCKEIAGRFVSDLIDKLKEKK